MGARRLRARRAVAILAPLLVAGLYLWLEEGTLPSGAPAARSGDAILAEAFREQRSGLVVEGDGVVEAVLRDDLHGSRHQRFILRLASGQSLLVSHNIDLAPRVADLGRGDPVAFRGQYEWNDRGGVLHWTHADPDGRRPGGWLRHRGRTYR